MEAPSKKSVLITGINGFTGVHLEKLFLNKGFTVYGTTRVKTNNNNHFVCDITRKEDIRKVFAQIDVPNFIIHTAAISFVAVDNQTDMYSVNVFGTLNLLDIIIENKIKPDKILVVSSAAVYGNVGGILSEDMHPNPVNHYGNSKLVMENMTKTYFSRLNIIIARPFNYTGLGQSNNFLVPKIVLHFKNKAANIQLGNIDVYREFNSIDYLTSCYFRLLHSNYKSETVNICSGKVINIKDILLTLEKISNHNIKVEINPDFVRENEIKSLRGSNVRLKKLIDLPVNNNLEVVLTNMYFN